MCGTDCFVLRCFSDFQATYLRCVFLPCFWPGSVENGVHGCTVDLNSPCLLKTLPTSWKKRRGGEWRWPPREKGLPLLFLQEPSGPPFTCRRPWFISREKPAQGDTRERYEVGFVLRKAWADFLAPRGLEKQASRDQTFRAALDGMSGLCVEGGVRQEQ